MLLEAKPRMLASLAAFTVCLTAWPLQCTATRASKLDLERLQAEFADL